MYIYVYIIYIYVHTVHTYNMFDVYTTYKNIRNAFQFTIMKKNYSNLFEKTSDVGNKMG